MAAETTSITTSTSERSEKDGTKKKDGKTKDKDAPPTKVVVRRLPPTLTVDTFLEQVGPLPDNDYFDYVQADLELGNAAFCRAYINFLNLEDLYIFTEKFDNYVFVDSKGYEYAAVVEYAPYQKIPKKKLKKTDARRGTIETDSDFLKFKEAYENPAPVENAFSPEVVLDEIEAKEKELKANNGVLKVSTPLLEYLRKKKEEKKQANIKLREDRKKREEERRLKRDEERKKKRDRERERDRLRQKDRDRQRQKEQEREREQRKNRDRDKDGNSSAEPRKFTYDDLVLLLTKTEGDEVKSSSIQDRGDRNDGNKKQDKPFDVRPKQGDYKAKEKSDQEKRREKEERERRRREKEDEEERKWRERERERKEKREKERKEREKREKERREKERERREREKKDRELEREKEATENKSQPDKYLTSDLASLSITEKSKDPMIESTSSIDEQNDGQQDSDKRGQRQRARYKDRPERQIYNPGQRAAERRKQMESRGGQSSKNSTPPPSDDSGRGENQNNNNKKSSVHRSASNSDSGSSQSSSKRSSHKESKMNDR